MLGSAKPWSEMMFIKNSASYKWTVMLKDTTPLKNPHSSQNKDCNDLNGMRLFQWLT